MKKVIPKYANLKLKNDSPASQVTSKKAQIMRIKDEIKILFKKKEKLHHDLYTRLYVVDLRIFSEGLMMIPSESKHVAQGQ